ncbi:MAG TPA: stage II sporulation protein M [Blastocatellia bacterium]|nr:stage II sporulation protein M [Blastocatellia bacterium]
MLKNFLESRLEMWKRLEELTARVSRFRLKTLSGAEVRDQRLVNYLNHLVGRAHGAIYRSESSGFGVFLDFFRYEFPAVFRKTFSYILTSFLLFLLSAAFAWGACFFDEGFADQISPRLRQDIAAHHNWTESVNDANPIASTSIQTNNITVTFLAFAGGVLIGLGTIWVLIQNGLLLGLVMGLCVKYKFWEIPIFVSAHGVIELTAIFIAGGAGLMIGKALLMPGDLRRIDALVMNGLQAIKLILGCIPMLLIAGLIEGFISPAHIPSAIKFTISGMSALTMTAYFLKPDRRELKAEA